VYFPNFDNLVQIHWPQELWDQITMHRNVIPVPKQVRFSNKSTRIAPPTRHKRKCATISQWYAKRKETITK